LIESLLDAGFSFRTIARLAKCSHGSVSAQKKEWLAKKLEAERKLLEKTPPKEFETQVASTPTIIIPPEIAARIAEAGIQTVEALGNESDTPEA
jgi:hypothetical protein